MATSATIRQYMQAMTQGFQPDRAGGLKATYQLQLRGDGESAWTISIDDQQINITPGAPPRSDTAIAMNTDTYLKWAAGSLNINGAIQQGQIKIYGNLQLAQRFAQLFNPWASLIPPDPAPAPSPIPATPPPIPAAPQPPAAPALADYARTMPNGFRADRAGGLKATYQFEISGQDSGIWTVTVSRGTCAVSSARIDSPNVIIRMSDANFIKLAQGQLNTTSAYRQGQIQISGDLNLAAKIPEIFGAWADTIGATPYPTPPPPTPTPPTSPTPTPKPTPPPASGSVYPQLMNGSFDEYQPFVFEGEAKVWKENQFPEQYGAYWSLQTIDAKRGRYHMMNSGVFGKFTQKYYGGGGRDYHIHGRHSQVITSRRRFDLVLYQTVAAQPGRDYTFSGSLVSFYKGTSGPPVHNKIFKTIGIDPTGGRDYSAPSVVWGKRDGRDNEWRYPSLKVKAGADAITVFIRLENEEKDVGETELNIIHLDNFELK